MTPIPIPGSKLIPMFSVKFKKFRTLNELRGGMIVTFNFAHVTCVTVSELMSWSWYLNHFLRHEENILFSYKWTNVSCVACVTTTSDTRILTVKKQ